MTKTTENITRTSRIPAGTTAGIATAAGIIALSLVTVACETDASVPDNQADVVIDTIGDTIIVRTLAGSVWDMEATLRPEVSIGELDGPEEYLLGRVASIAVDDDHNVYVLDWQAQEILQYDALGDYVRTVARRGEGPGELVRANQMALLPDGRLVVPDANNQRVQLFGPGATDREEWPLESSHPYGTHRLWTDTAGRTWILHLAMPATDMDAMLRGVVIVRGPDGTHLDTLPGPTGDFDPPSAHRFVEAQRPDGSHRPPNGARSLQSGSRVGGPSAWRDREGNLERLPHRSASRGAGPPHRTRL